MSTDQSAALIAANAELARVREELEEWKKTAEEVHLHALGTIADLSDKRDEERALADDLAKALEGFDQLIEDRAKGHVVVYSDRFLRLQPAAKAALERHRGARGT